MNFTFGEFNTHVFISREIPGLEKIASDLGCSKGDSFKPLIVCDENTSAIADIICGSSVLPRCALKSGEENKNWHAVETILSAAQNAQLGRDGIFIAVGGGVICDLCAFAASIYMRGCSLVLVSTTLLGMVDASVGGKTGFDLFGIKNLAGTFYPSQIVYMPLDCLVSLPAREWKSGMAELIKTAILAGDDFLEQLTPLKDLQNAAFEYQLPQSGAPLGKVLHNCIEMAVMYKGGIVSEDLRESGKRRLLNLGHTFAHALESSAGLGNITHGEAVAWGIVRSCELGCALGVTPRNRAEQIAALIKSFGYGIESPHPLMGNRDVFLNAMKNDKKKKMGRLTFIVPDEKSAQCVTVESENDLKTVEKIIIGEYVP